jgi:hypothetical protein
MAGNRGSQFMPFRAEYTSEDNCFQTPGPESLATDYVLGPKYKTLAEYQREKGQDLHSREGCGPLPQKIDVQRLHAETMAYTERARKILSERATAKTPAPEGTKSTPAGGKAPTAE